MPEPIVYDIQAPGLDRMIESMSAATAAAPRLESAIEGIATATQELANAQKATSAEQAKGQTVADRATIAAEKAMQKAAIAAQKKAEAQKQAAAEMASAAERAELAANRLSKEGTRAYETILKVGGEYGQMLRDGVKETSELAKTWRAGLSPAERTALNLAKLSAVTDEAAEKSASFGLATANATEKLQDQIRRQDQNVGSQNKLSRSLSELLQQQTDAILKGQQMVGALSAQGVAQAKAAESAKDLTLVLRQLEFDTSDADKSSEQYKATVAALQARIKGLALEEERASAESKRTAEAYGKQKQQLDALETAMDAIGVPGAGMVTRFKQISDSLETVSEHGSKTQATLLKTGIAVGSVGAATAAAVAGITAIGAAIVAVTSQAADWNAELKDVGLSIEQAPLERYAASISTVGNVIKAMGVQVAATFGPAIESAATRIAALGLAGLDAFKNLSKGEDVMTRLARVASTVLVEAFMLPVTALQKMMSAMAEPFKLLENIPGTVGVTAKALGVMGTAATAVGSSLDAWKTEQVDAMTVSISMLGRDAMAPLVAVSNDYMGAAEKLVAKQAAVNAAARDGAAAAREQAAAIQELQIAARDSIMTIGETVPSAFREAQQATAGISQEMIQSATDASKKTADKMAEMARKGKESWSGSFSAIGSAAGQLATLMIGYSRKKGDAAAKAAIAAFRIEQAAASASAVVSAYQGAMKAIGELPPPASYVAAGAAIATGVAALAAIWAQPEPSASGGGAASISNPVSGGISGGGGSSAGVKSMPAYKAEQMGEVTGTSAGPKVDTSGLSASAPVQVTDAYIAPSSSSMQIRTTPGDAVSIERGGAKADRDGAILRLLQELVDQSRSQGRIMMDLVSELQMGRHRQAVSIGGVY
jgi:hypothetical protein